jgi:hypothetical protein
MTTQTTELEGEVHVIPRKEGRKEVPNDRREIKLWLKLREWIDN